MEDIASNSKVIFYGEVIGAERVGKMAESGTEQLYKITLYPQKVYKGRAKKKYTFKGYSIYNDPDKDEFFVGGCSLDVDLGGKYIIMVEQGEKTRWSWCSQHILPKGTSKYDYFIKNIKKKL